MTGETVAQQAEVLTDEQLDIVKSLETAIEIVKANPLTREQALGVVTKMLQPASPNSY